MLTVASGGYFPGGLVAKTLSFQCRVPGFNLLSGNYILHAQTKEFTCCNQDLMQPNKYTLKKKNKKHQQLPGKWKQNKNVFTKGTKWLQLC